MEARFRFARTRTQNETACARRHGIKMYAHADPGTRAKEVNARAQRGGGRDMS